MSGGLDAFERMLIDRFDSVESQLSQTEGRVSQKLAEQDKVLADIRSEVRITNGRVTKLEGDKKVEQALVEQSNLLAKDRLARTTQRWSRVNVMVSLAAAMVAGATYPVGHAIGVW